MQRRNRNPDYVKGPYLQGKRWVRQYRRNGRTIRLPDGRDLDQKFWDAYYEAERQVLAGEVLLPAATARIKAGSVEAVLIEYYKSVGFANNLKESTRERWRGVLENDLRAGYGDLPVAKIKPRFLMDLIADKVEKTSGGTAKILGTALRSFCRFAVAAGYIDSDPSAGIKGPRIETDGYHAWTESEIEAFLAYWPAGSLPHLALAFHLYTAQRLSDVIALGAQHLGRDGVLRFSQVKTGTALAIPVHPELRRLLDMLPPPAPAPSGETHLNFLRTKTGLPFDDNYYGWNFRQWVKAVPGLPAACSSHGLRKASMIRLAHLGLSAPAIAAISGHKDLKEVQRYIEQANRETLARLAIDAMPVFAAAAPAAVA